MSKDTGRFNKFCKKYDMYADGVEEDVIAFLKKNKTKKKFTKKNIKENNLSIIKYIDKIKLNYDYILVAVISPLFITRNIAKKKFKKKYYEIYVKCNLNTLIKRDTKGLYKLAKDSKLKNLIGFKSKINYEISNYKKIVINTDKLTINNSLKKSIRKYYKYLMKSSKFKWNKKCAIYIGRFQPFHQGHKKIVIKAIKKYGQIAILVMNSYGIGKKTHSIILK